MILVRVSDDQLTILWAHTAELRRIFKAQIGSVAIVSTQKRNDESLSKIRKAVRVIKEEMNMRNMKDSESKH